MEEKKLPKSLEVKLIEILEKNYKVVEGIVRITDIKSIDKEWLAKQYFDSFVEYIGIVKDNPVIKTDNEYRKGIISFIQENIAEGLASDYEQAFFDVNAVIEYEIGKETYSKYFNGIRDWVGDHLMVGFTAKEIETFNFYKGESNNG